MRANARTRVLKDLVRESQYVVDPAAIAEAIIARSIARQTSPFSSMPSIRPARTCRHHHRGGRSVRMRRPERRPSHRAGGRGSSHPR
jgi:hypothetical protein